MAILHIAHLELILIHENLSNPVQKNLNYQLKLENRD